MHDCQYYSTMQKLIILILFLSSAGLADEKRLSIAVDIPQYVQRSEHNSLNYNSRVRFLVLHYTSSNWQRSLELLTLPEYEVSAHYLIPESFDDTYNEQDLAVYQLVDENDRAWHAGKSQWEDRENINDQSIGIELVNNSACYYQDDNETLDFTDDYLCSFRDYDPKQIQLLIALSKQILDRHLEITPTRVIGHADIQPGVKSDPGPKFPWYTLHQHGIGAWYEHETVNKYWLKFTEEAMPSIAQIQCGLKSYGYGIELTGEYDEQTYDFIRAFQLHFQPWQTGGRTDSKTVATLWALLEKYFPNILDVEGKLQCQ